MLESIGLQSAMSRWVDAPDAALGRVVRVDRGLACVLTEDGPVRAGLGGALLSRMAADATQAPCTGDWCVLRSWPDHRVSVECVLPRRTAVVRAVAGERSHGQVLCANADLVAVVVALHPLPALTKVERLVALAWQSGARPVVVLTKTDLVRDADEIAEDVAAAAPGVEVLTVSSRTRAGVDRLRSLMERRLTLALVGTSGHGKSSLANALVGADVLATREIRADGRGRHTSVRRELVPMPGGGAVIDTPGLRGVGLLDAGAGLSRTFDDVVELDAECRFDDCAHRGEPGCAVAAAIADGALPQRRFDSWLRLQQELADITTRTEDRLRAVQRKQHRRARQAGRARR